MIDRNVILNTKLMLLAGVLASGILVLSAGAQSPAPAGKPAQAAKPSPAAGAPYRFRPSHSRKQEEMYYSSMWGVDSLSVKAVESGEIIRFSYRVMDSTLAKTVNVKSLEPALIDPEAGVSLVVPSLEQVGMLRQSSKTPEVGKSYWMAFSNSGRRVKPGDRVIVQIGQFRAAGLIVE
jgi:hypothetical protein